MSFIHSRWILLGVFFFAALSLQAGGFILVTPSQHENAQHVPHNRLFPLEVRSLNVDATIVGQTATTTIKQVFFNPGRQQLEGHFLFPVPKGVVITDFKMIINGVVHQAELLEASKARKIYEEIVRRAKDPALLEYYNNRLFRVRIFPILPQKEQKIELTYTETLVRDQQTIAYNFPMNTQKYAAKSPQQFSLKINVGTQHDLKTIYSPTHNAEIVRKNNRTAVVGFEAEALKADRDFQLYFSTDDKALGLSVLTYKAPKEAGFFFANISPGFDKATKTLPKDIVFVLDKSGSMAGEKMQQAQKALQFCIENLNPEDCFDVVAFSTEATSLFGKVSPNGKGSKKQALEFVEQLQPIGGTNIEEALTLALDAQEKESKRPFFIIFLTDGKPTIGETNQEQLLQKVQKHNQQQVRIFTFGIGTNLNTHLLDKLTKATNAYSTYVLPEEDIEVKLSNFYTKASSPVMTNIQLEFDKNIRVSDLYDKTLPDLFKGESITVMGRYHGTGKSKLTVSGDVDGKRKKFEYEVVFSNEQTELNFIPNLWAARAVGYLLEQIRLNGSNPELVESVTVLAKKYGIITPYTSYLIVEDEEVAARQRNIPIEDQLLRSRSQEAPTIFSNDDFAEEAESIAGNPSSKRKSGKASVRASQEQQTLNKASNLGAAEKGLGLDRLNYTNSAGESKNMGSDIVNVQGRAFYLNNNQWLDANIALSDKTNRKATRVQFNSAAYFKLLQNKAAVPFLALGRNVRFELQEGVYEVYE
ncbi:MAG: VIT and vWA domain-containing protein [Aureispira sp.]